MKLRVEIHLALFSRLLYAIKDGTKIPNEIMAIKSHKTVTGLLNQDFCPLSFTDSDITLV
jgi:hypothetical protein